MTAACSGPLGESLLGTFDPLRDPLIEAHPLGLSADRRPTMRFGIDAKRNPAAVGPIRRLAAFGAEREIIVDTFAEGLLDFGEGRAFESDHIAQTGNAAEEDPVFRRNSADIAFLFEHQRSSFSGLTPAAARKSPTAAPNRALSRDQDAVDAVPLGRLRWPPCGQGDYALRVIPAAREPDRRGRPAGRGPRHPAS
jgi:hypothetical protein